MTNAGTTFFISTVSALLLVAVSSQARADERLQVGLGAGAQFVPMDSMDSVTRSVAYGVARLDASISLPEISIIPGYELEAGVGWDFGTIDGTTYNRIDSKLDIDTLVATGKLRRQLHGPISAFAQAKLGVQWARLRLEDASSARARPLEGKAVVPVLGLGGGVELNLKQQYTGDFSVGMRLDAHYQLAGSMGFNATPRSGGDDRLEIDTRASELGSINSSGMTLGMSLIARY